MSLHHNRFEVTAFHIIHQHDFHLPSQSGFSLMRRTTPMPKKLLEPTFETTNSNMQLDTLSFGSSATASPCCSWKQLSPLPASKVYMNTLEYTNSNSCHLKAQSTKPNTSQEIFWFTQSIFLIITHWPATGTSGQRLSWAALRPHQTDSFCSSWGGLLFSFLFCFYLQFPYPHRNMTKKTHQRKKIIVNTILIFRNNAKYSVNWHIRIHNC